MEVGAIFYSFKLLVTTIPIFTRGAKGSSVISAGTLSSIIMSTSGVDHINSRLIVCPGDRRQGRTIGKFKILRGLGVPKLVVSTGSGRISIVKLRTALCLGKRRYSVQRVRVLHPHSVRGVRCRSTPSKGCTGSGLIIGFVAGRCQCKKCIRTSKLRAVKCSRNSCGITAGCMGNGGSCAIFTNTGCDRISNARA